MATMKTYTIGIVSVLALGGISAGCYWGYNRYYADAPETPAAPAEAAPADTPAASSSTPTSASKRELDVVPSASYEAPSQQPVNPVQRPPHEQPQKSPVEPLRSPLQEHSEEHDRLQREHQEKVRLQLEAYGREQLEAFERKQREEQERKHRAEQEQEHREHQEKVRLQLEAFARKHREEQMHREHQANVKGHRDEQMHREHQEKLKQQREEQTRREEQEQKHREELEREYQENLKQHREKQMRREEQTRREGQTHQEDLKRQEEQKHREELEQEYQENLKRQEDLQKHWENLEHHRQMTQQEEQEWQARVKRVAKLLHPEEPNRSDPVRPDEPEHADELKDWEVIPTAAAPALPSHKVACDALCDFLAVFDRTYASDEEHDFRAICKEFREGANEKFPKFDEFFSAGSKALATDDFSFNNFLALTDMKATINLAETFAEDGCSNVFIFLNEMNPDLSRDVIVSLLSSDDAFAKSPRRALSITRLIALYNSLLYHRKYLNTDFFNPIDSILLDDFDKFFEGAKRYAEQYGMLLDSRLSATGQGVMSALAAANVKHPQDLELVHAGELQPLCFNAKSINELLSLSLYKYPLDETDWVGLKEFDHIVARKHMAPSMINNLAGADYKGQARDEVFEAQVKRRKVLANLVQCAIRRTKQGPPSPRRVPQHGAETIV